ncbi:hypothetical protein E2542_SST11513 [Spatholobus suberectus]|nr:hypothetical protein E2542_SST11513 [Spatholobus suberectus]
MSLMEMGEVKSLEILQTRNRHFRRWGRRLSCCRFPMVGRVRRRQRQSEGRNGGLQ